MDPLDFAIYRYLSRGGEARFWGGRRIIDPRITPREIAERVAISESGVRSRLRRLAERGYLRDTFVTPNPSLFGKRAFVADLPVKHPGEVDRILRDLALVEGVVFTRDLMDEDQRKIQVHFLSDSEATAARLGALIGRLSPAGGPAAPRLYYIPPCERELSPLCWRVLESVWRAPDATLAEIAKAAGIALKTAARSYQQLIESHACWWTHGPSSEEFPLAFVGASLRRPQAFDAVMRWVTEEATAWMPVACDGFGVEPERLPNMVAGLVPADAPTVLERFLRGLAGVDGVARVQRTFPLGSTFYPSWFSDKLSAHVQRGP